VTHVDGTPGFNHNDLYHRYLRRQVPPALPAGAPNVQRPQGQAR
jgi:hypothetical protein